MKTYADKKQENKSRVATGTFQRNSIGAGSSFQFIDHRAESAAQRELMELARNSPRAQEPLQLQGRTQPTPIASDYVIQCRALDKDEQERLENVKHGFEQAENEYIKATTKIRGILRSLKSYPSKNLPLSEMQYLYNRMEHYLPQLDHFFMENIPIAARAPNSVSALRKLERRLTWYQKSQDGKYVIELTLKDLEKRDQGSIAAERDDLSQITGFDERFFVQYLQQPKPPITVYRGDGRDVTATFLDNYHVQDIPAGGRPDISFYGVVQHTHSSTNKNGMVSTTSDRDQAYHWAIDDHTYGVVYEFQLTNYIDVADLLHRRNFKNRFAAQREILAPGNIPAADFVSVSLYEKTQGLIRQISI